MTSPHRCTHPLTSTHCANCASGYLYCPRCHPDDPGTCTNCQSLAPQDQAWRDLRAANARAGTQTAHIRQQRLQRKHHPTQHSRPPRTPEQRARATQLERKRYARDPERFRAQRAERRAGAGDEPYFANKRSKARRSIHQRQRDEESSRASKQRHHAEYAATARAYYAQHTEQQRARVRESYDAHRTEILAHNKRPQALAYDRQYRATHKDQLRANQAAYKERHLDEIADRQRNWYDQHREQIRAADRARYQLRKLKAGRPDTQIEASTVQTDDQTRE